MNPLDLLNPGAWWGLLSVPALVLLYMLRPRSRRKAVPSLRLWRELPQVERPTPRLRRPPLSWLLLLQALLLGAGAFALMRPAVPAPAARHVIVLLDTSGSMQAREGSTSRFEVGRAEAAKLPDNLRVNDRATLLGVGPGITTACSACTAGDFQLALREMQPGAGRADWPAALALATGLAADQDVSTYIISDGAFDPLSADNLPPDTHFISVGSPAANRAITALSARRPPNGTAGYSAYARVENTSPNPASLLVQALADTVPLPSRNLNIPAGGHADVTWQVPDGTLKLTVSLGEGDALAADNSAVLFLPGEGQDRVLVHSDHPDLYMRALLGYHGLQPVTDTLKSEAATAFTIWEGALPATLPPGGLLLVNPSGGPFAVQGDLAGVGGPEIVGRHPLLADLDLRALYVDKASKLGVPSWLDSLVQAPNGPLLLAGERDGRRIAVLTFDPRDSNLPKLAAFPLLMANMADWLYPQAGVGALHPGDAAPVPPGSIVTTPTGRKIAAGEEGVFGDTGEVGIYSVEAGNGKPGLFAVNMADGRESDLTPIGHPELERAAVAGSMQVVTQDFWLPFAAAALLLAGGEWLLYCLKRGRI